MKRFMSSNSVDKSDVNDPSTYVVITLEFLNTLRTLGLPNLIIKLIAETLITFMKNLDQSEGLCNGIRLIVTIFNDHILEINIMSGKHESNIIYILRMTKSPSQSHWSLKLSRRQFSLLFLK